MNIQMTAHNIELTDALKEHATNKLNHIKPGLEQVTNMHITFNHDKLNHIVEGKLHVPGQEIYAKADSTENMYTAIDALVDKLSRQLIKYKEKHSQHRE